MFCLHLRIGSRGTLTAWQAPFPCWLHNAKAANVELSVNSQRWQGSGGNLKITSRCPPFAACRGWLSLNSVHSLTPVTRFFLLDLYSPTSRSF